MTSSPTWSSITLVSYGLYFILHVAYLMSLLGTDILKGDPLGLLDITDDVCITSGCYGNDVMHIAGCERPR